MVTSLGRTRKQGADRGLGGDQGGRIKAVGSGARGDDALRSGTGALNDGLAAEIDGGDFERRVSVIEGRPAPAP